MTFLPIASNLPFGSYMPLVVVLVGFAVVSVFGNTARGHGDRGRAWAAGRGSDADPAARAAPSGATPWRSRYLRVRSRATTRAPTWSPCALPFSMPIGKWMPP